MSRITGIVCSPRVYSYKGWTFEVSSAPVPWPLRKDGELRARAGNVFWRIYSGWEGLPDDEKQRTRVGGGCVRF